MLSCMPQSSRKRISPQNGLCLIFAQCEISLTNQGTFQQSKFLRTILSTKDVQNIVTPHSVAKQNETVVAMANPAWIRAFAAMTAVDSSAPTPFCHEFTGCLVFVH
jgi:hypothetical protein